MKPTRLQRLLTIVDKALALEPEEQAEYLNAVCGEDTILRGEIGKLIEAAGVSESFWENWKQWNEEQIERLFQELGKENPTNLVNQYLGQYHLLEQLGDGGMGVVYRARDTHLERDVAVKVLTQKIPGSLTSRLLREARAASALNHPNIVTIHEVGKHGDTDFIVMEYVNGEPLDAVIRHGLPEIEEALRICTRIADGLAAAHAKGLVHRDIKPGNVIITPSGQAKILDFGVARQAQMADGHDTAETVNPSPEPEIDAPGTIAGTPGYLAPELLEGGIADARSDVFALGVTLYQFISGKWPFGEKTRLTAIPVDNPQTLTDVRSDVPGGMARIVDRCLAHLPEDRYSSAQEVARELNNLQSLVVARIMRTTRARLVALIAVVLISIFVLGWWQIQDRQVRLAREVIPQIEQLAGENRNVEAFLLAERAAGFLPEDPVLRELQDRISIPVHITSEPRGAEVFFQDYRIPDAEFHSLGHTPLEDVRVPWGYLRWKVEREGYETLEAGAESIWGALDFLLIPEGVAPEGMLYVPPGSGEFGILRFFFGADEQVEVPGFWFGETEVTNREFQRFVDAGGYREPQYWQRAIEAAGNEYSWEELMAQFRDSTGHTGPATWSSGRYPEGMEDYPVSGVSWFEAAAYAEFAGKSLPTVYHWRRAAHWTPFGDYLLQSNFEADGPAPAGRFTGVGQFGHYDLAGNLAEWCWNRTPEGQRYLLGGSWAEPGYTFAQNYARPPLERNANFGFRLAEFDSPPPEELFGPVEIERHDFSQEVPASDDIFAIYRSQFDYDPIPLEPQTDTIDESPQYWRRETVSFTAAYGEERIMAHLFLPRDAEPPYKTVVYVPGTTASFVSSITDMGSDLSFFIPRNGRALVWPVYEGTLERGGGQGPGVLSARAYRDRIIRRVNDLQRTIDFLETRGDIDSSNLAYLGLSVGGEYGPVYTAIEQRFRVLVYLAGGFNDYHMLEEPEEILPWHYAPRVTAPILMINGRSDHGIPVEQAQQPMFDLLGTALEHKRHIILEGGHVPFDMDEAIRLILDWLDRYQRVDGES